MAAVRCPVLFLIVASEREGSVKLSLTFAAACVLLLATSVARAEETDETIEQKLVISIERIWDRAEHNAFTDLIRFKGKLYCTFREGSGHIPGLNGTIRVIRSADGQNWESVALLAEQHVDLRDPKLSITPDGRLMVSTGASYYHGSKRQKIESRVAFSDENGENFSRPQKVQLPEQIVTNFDWLWRVTWRGDIGWGALQQVPPGSKRRLHLVKTTDGIHYQHVTELELSSPTETTLRFEEDGTMIAMIRHHQNKAFVGRAEPPYTKWELKEANKLFGGPNFVQLPGGAWLAGSRDYEQRPYTTALWLMEPETAQFRDLITLPSGGDTSYPGFVIDEDRNQVLVSYYSGHEGRTSIYLVTLRLDVLQELARQQ